MPVTCNRCNKDMMGPAIDSGLKNEHGDPIAGRPILPGFSMRLELPEGADESYAMFVQQQLGAFQMSKDYRLCMECTLIKMGVTP